MTYNSDRDPDEIIDGFRQVTYDTNQSLERHEIAAVGFRIEGAAGEQGDPGDHTPTDGGNGGLASGLVPISDTAFTVWAPSDRSGQTNGGSPGTILGNSNGGEGGGNAALEVGTTTVASGGGGGGGGGVYSADTDGQGGGGGGARGGAGGAGSNDGGDGEDAGGNGTEGGDGGDGGTLYSAEDGDPGDGYVSSDVLGAETQPGTNSSRDGYAELWIYTDFRGPEVGVEYIGQAVSLTWEHIDCDEYVVYRDGVQIATTGTESYTDEYTLGSSVDYQIAASYGGIEQDGPTHTVDYTTTAISGVAEREGAPVAGATVLAINRDEDIVEAATTSGSDGSYSLDVRPGYEYHVVTEYDDGETQYNAPSYPFITV